MDRLTTKYFRPTSSIKQFNDIVLLEMYDKLKEYEDLEEQGLLLRLPCKPSDVTVYQLRNSNKRLFGACGIFLFKQIHIAAAVVFNTPSPPSKLIQC